MKTVAEQDVHVKPQQKPENREEQYLAEEDDEPSSTVIFILDPAGTGTVVDFCETDPTVEDSPSSSSSSMSSTSSVSLTPSRPRACPKFWCDPHGLCLPLTIVFVTMATATTWAVSLGDVMMKGSFGDWKAVNWWILVLATGTICGVSIVLLVSPRNSPSFSSTRTKGTHSSKKKRQHEQPNPQTDDPTEQLPV